MIITDEGAQMRITLLNWLDSGAPGYAFDMKEGLRIAGDRISCCMAGFIAFREGIRPYPGKESADWREVQDVALAALCLPRLSEPHVFFAHPVFNAHMAPQGCSPAEAAKALRFAFDSPNCPNPWQALDA